MSNHTPGPWRHVRDRSFSCYDHPGTKWGAASIEADSGCVQQLAHGTHDSLYPQETDANIRLIAAAPDLLAACKVLALSDRTKDPMALRQLRAAVAKADGTKSYQSPVLPATPRILVCPECGNDRLLYVEDIGFARDVASLDLDGTLRYTAYTKPMGSTREQIRECNAHPASKSSRFRLRSSSTSRRRCKFCVP
jgi:hypothetical protein